jgi:hypothetical protein
VAVEDITLRRPTLDEVFLALTGRTTKTSDGTKKRADEMANTSHKESAA